MCLAQLLEGTAQKRCHPERERRISPTCVMCSALVRSLDCARDDMAMLRMPATRRSADVSC
jgi:hypothetical protein